MISDRMDINNVLMEMRSLKAQAQAVKPAESVDTNPVRNTQALNQADNDAPGFGQLLDQAVNKVNDLQKTSNSMSTAFQQGQSGVDITDVMIASQKASVSFQAMLQVRNKLVESYRDIMNMPV